MPNRYFNWTFTDVESFLRKNKFVCIRTSGSHYHYSTTVSGKPRLVQVPFHGNNTRIDPRTIKSIIMQSGLPKEKWFGN